MLNRVSQLKVTSLGLKYKHDYKTTSTRRTICCYTKKFGFISMFKDRCASSFSWVAPNTQKQTEKLLQWKIVCWVESVKVIFSKHLKHKEETASFSVLSWQCLAKNAVSGVVLKKAPLLRRGPLLWEALGQLFIMVNWLKIKWQISLPC